MKKTRVLLVEDSPTVRNRLREVLSADPDIELVGEAADGKQAIALCLALKPDVITMDMMMPVMTGLATTEYLMAHCPTPILIVSSSTNRGELFRTYDALAAGAVDVLEKPRGDEPEGVWEEQFLSTLKLVSRIRVITHVRGRFQASASPGLSALPAASTRCALMAIGASTGGPSAIIDILNALPAELSAPLLLVLHINEPFGTAFADWLDRQTHHRVALARDGDPVDSARILMAPPDSHMVVENLRIRLTRDPERHSCRPSVDVLFESLARSHGPAVTACLLTGMGRDGAQGLLAIRNAGGDTIAQDEASSVVFGMPREAILLGAAARILPLSEIGPALAVVGAGKDRAR
ncbi:MAG: response regulator receiver modulated CheB methylesterase [Myxococcales bacterium]|nr:response regulator receiver modulated CheB methylesterase [Myxococcales bacterium]